ncbi:MAG: hypothetical protein ACOX5G_03505 [Kiritimatiellia bacterium]|jgi:hypothetical protein
MHYYKFLVGSIALASSVAFSANITWDGNGGGNWSEGTNWVGGIAPVTADKAILPDVSAGIREVTVDQDSEASGLTITQTTDGGATAVTLDADLTLYSTQWDGSPTTITPTAGDAAISFDLNGHAFTARDNYGRRMALQIDGTWNIGPGSMLAMIQTGNQSGLKFTSNGILSQHDGGVIRYRYEIPTGNSGGTRAYVNNGIWTMSNGSLFEFSHNLGHSPGGFGYLTGCENNGSLSILSGSTNHFGSLSNNGTMVIGDNARLGHAKASPTFSTGADGVTSVIGSNAALWSESGSGVSTLDNNGVFTIGDGVATNDFTVVSGSATVNNQADGEMTILTNSTLVLKYTGVQGHVNLNNAGNLHVNGGLLKTDWAATANNNGTRNFANSGHWRIDNGGAFRLTSSTGRSIWGFYSPSNTGTLELDNGSLQFIYLYNQGGRIVLEDNADFGGPRLSSTYTFHNQGGLFEVAGIGNVVGTLTQNHGGGCNLAFTSSDAVDHYEYVTNIVEGVEVVTTNTFYKSATVRIGTNDMVAADVTLAAWGNAVYTANGGTTTDVARAASLVLSSGNTRRDSRGDAYLANYGFGRQGGYIGFRPNFNGTCGLRNYGVWNIDSGADGVAVIEHLPAPGGQNPSCSFENYGGSSFGGSGTLAYINSSYNGYNNVLTISNSGAIRPSGGLLAISNAVVTCSSGSSLVIDAATPETCGRLALVGDGATFSLPGSGATLDVQLPAKADIWGGSRTIRIVEAAGVSGQFESMTVNGADPSESRAICTLEYGATYIDLTVSVPSGTLLLLR